MSHILNDTQMAPSVEPPSPNSFSAQNPLNVVPPTNALKFHIRSKLASSLPKPLVVLMAEEHDVPMHVAMQQALMSALLGPLVYGRKLRIAHGAEGFMQHAAGVTDGAELPVSMQQKLLGWSRRNLWTRTIDAALDVPYALNLRHSVNQNLIRMYPPETMEEKVGKLVTTGSPEYIMRIRNLAMATHIGDHIMRDVPDVYVATLGATHVFGSLPGPHNGEANHHFEYSLTVLLELMGFEIMPVFMPGPKGLGELPPYARDALADQGFMITGLDCERIPADAPDLERRQMRKLNMINQASGKALAFVNANYKRPIAKAIAPNKVWNGKYDGLPPAKKLRPNKNAAPAIKRARRASVLKP